MKVYEKKNEIKRIDMDKTTTKRDDAMPRLRGCFSMQTNEKD